MKPYKRNYAIGLGLFIVGLAVTLLTEGIMDVVGKLTAGSGLILAGWSGRQWWYYERQANG